MPGRYGRHQLGLRMQAVGLRNEEEKALLAQHTSAADKLQEACANEQASNTQLNALPISATAAAAASRVNQVRYTISANRSGNKGQKQGEVHFAPHRVVMLPAVMSQPFRSSWLPSKHV